MILQDRKEEIRQVLIKSIENIYSIQYNEFEIAGNKKEGYGDFTSTVAFSLSKELKKPPIDIANQIMIEGNIIAAGRFRIEAVAPGFMNIQLPIEWKFGVMEEIQTMKIDYGEKIKNLLVKQPMGSRSLYYEMEYIENRTQWVLEVLQGEGVKTSVAEISLKDLKISYEDTLLNYFVDFMELMEEGTLRGNKLVPLMQEIVETFWKYYNSLMLRKLEDSHRNLVLNIFTAMKNIMTI